MENSDAMQKHASDVPHWHPVSWWIYWWIISPLTGRSIWPILIPIVIRCASLSPTGVAQ